VTVRATRCGAFAAAARYEPLEHEPRRVEPADHECHDQRRRPRYGADHVAGVDGGANESRPWVADTWRPRIRDDGDVVTAGEQTQHFIRAGNLGVLVSDGEAHSTDPRVRQQFPAVPGVFAADECAGLQRLDRSRRQVAEVADRGAHEH
jgi:hypothetical protein